MEIKRIKILIAEDDTTSAYLMKETFANENYDVTITYNGKQGLLELQKDKYDILLTDWMMPVMDGIELVRKTRSLIKPCPIIVMVTALSSYEAKRYAMESGADEFITKPIRPDNVISLIQKILFKKNQSVFINKKPVICKKETKPPFIPVLIGASSGGPITIKKIFKDFKVNKNVVFFIVLHGPSWMFETYADDLNKETAWPVRIAHNNEEPKPGTIYIAPGDNHLFIDKHTFYMRLNNDDFENYVRPAVDPLFRSAASAFGKYCIGVILTGMGCDGSKGSMDIYESGGVVLAQSPETAIVSSMPERVISLGVVKEVVPIDKMSNTIQGFIHRFERKLFLNKD